MSQAVDRIMTSRASARHAVAFPGDWLTGAQRVDVWRETRAARSHELDLARLDALSPNAVDGRHGPSRELSADANEVVHRIASDPGRLSRSWAEAAIAELGEEHYTELVAVTAIVSVLDTYDVATEGELQPLPEPIEGAPSRLRPDDVGDVGAWVSQTTGPVRANVSRSVSLVPVSNATWTDLVTTHYSRGPEFFQVEWDRALTRPQIELVAARTTAAMECFY